MNPVRILLAIAVIGVSPAVSAAVHDEVVKKINACMATANPDQRHACLLKATPRKCRSFLRDRRMAMSMSLRQQWQTCLATCEGANLWSRTLGPCSTPSDPAK